MPGKQWIENLLEFGPDNRPVPGTSRALQEVWCYEAHDVYEALAGRFRGDDEMRFRGLVYAIARARYEFLDGILRPYFERRKADQIAAVMAKYGSK